VEENKKILQGNKWLMFEHKYNNKYNNKIHQNLHFY